MLVGASLTDHFVALAVEDACRTTGIDRATAFKRIVRHSGYNKPPGRLAHQAEEAGIATRVTGGSTPDAALDAELAERASVLARLTKPRPQDPLPTLLYEPSGYEIGLTHAVLETMRQEVLDAAWRYEEVVESGGILLGEEDGDGLITDIAAATGPGPGSSHTWGSVNISRRAADEILASNPRLREIGAWHSHPICDSVEPSPGDLRSSLKSAKRLGQNLEMILTPPHPGGGMWYGARVHGWLTHQTRRGWVCEPARVRAIDY